MALDTLVSVLREAMAGSEKGKFGAWFDSDPLSSAAARCRRYYSALGKINPSIQAPNSNNILYAAHVRHGQLRRLCYRVKSKL